MLNTPSLLTRQPFISTENPDVEVMTNQLDSCYRMWGVIIREETVVRLDLLYPRQHSLHFACQKGCLQEIFEANAYFVFQGSLEHGRSTCRPIEYAAYLIKAVRTPARSMFSLSLGHSTGVSATALPAIFLFPAFFLCSLSEKIIERNEYDILDLCVIGKEILRSYSLVITKWKKAFPVVVVVRALENSVKNNF
ncbi:uncharacterized protein G2W53_004984 [Senna tora]|uniref:Uncharacterized protein n=1 Tax=Senna tora TaxID=362788 RepID=A0A835CIN9_9FABA|nr:uncharacterized protein G2W53_004984 [Senna tora]